MELGEGKQNSAEFQTEKAAFYATSYTDSFLNKMAMMKITLIINKLTMKFDAVNDS